MLQPHYKFDSTLFKQLLVSVFNTGRFPKKNLEKCIKHFIDSIDPENGSGKRKIPHSVWVDKTIIKAAFADDNVDGFRIIPIRYTDDGQAPDGTPYKKDDVNFVIMFTHPKIGGGHQNDLDLLYDYNNPCPRPPCP